MRTSIRSTIVAILAVIALALAGATILVVYQGRIMPFLDRVVTVPFLEQDPATVIATMQRTMADLTTAQYNLDAAFAPAAGSESFGVQATVQFDGGFADGIVGELGVRGSMQLNSYGYFFKAQAHAGSEKFYYQFQELPAIPYLTLNTLQEIWYERDAFFSAPAQKTQLGAFQAALAAADLFQTVERLPDQTIAGTKTYHYHGTIRPAALNALVGGNAETVVRNSSVDMWIGKHDYFIYQADCTIVTNAGSFTVHAEIGDFEKTVKVELPADAQPTQEFIEALFGQTLILDAPSLLQPTGLFSATDLSDADTDGLSGIWEHLFRTDPSNDDTDADGFTDGEEVRSGHNPSGAGKLFSTL